jgi:hypothetical protein
MADTKHRKLLYQEAGFIANGIKTYTLPYCYHHTGHRKYFQKAWAGLNEVLGQRTPNFSGKIT